MTEDIFDPNYNPTAQGVESGADVDGDFAGGVVLDLSEDSLVPGGFKNPPIGTWLDLSIFEADLGESSSEANAGKPQYKFTFQTVGDEWGKNRRFQVWAPLWEGAAFTYVAVCHAVGRKPDPRRVFAPHVFLGQTLQGRVGQYAYGREFPPGRDRDRNLKAYEINPDLKVPNEDLIHPAYPRLTGFRSMKEAMEKAASQQENVSVFKEA